jgi:AAA family ATP:ADP antiporter
MGLAARLLTAWAEARAEIGGRRREFVWLALLAFLFTFSYALARPPAESQFLDAYGRERLPEAWIVGVLVMLIAVEIYARVAPRIGVLRAFSAAAAASAAFGLVVLTGTATGEAGAPFAVYVWKEAYILLLVESFWTAANLLFPIRTARWLYGLFCAAGALGGVAGSICAALLAGLVGTEGTLWAVLPCLVIAAAAALLVDRRVELPAAEKRSSLGGVFGALRLLGRSPYLIWVLALVMTTQVVITLIDYEYNGAVKAAFPDVDQRTQVIGSIYAAISISELLLQLATGPILRFLGVSRTLLAVPLLVGATLGVSLWRPGFALVAVTKVMSKALDYSLFRAAKEILYIPLGVRDKTEGKALIDMLVYRSTKGASYPLFRAVEVFSAVPVGAVTLGFVATWLWVTVRLVRRFRELETDAAAPSGQK